MSNGISPRKFRLGLNYRVNYDPVSKTSGTHVGPLVTLKLGGTSVKGAHGKKGYLHSIEVEGIRYADALGTIGLMNP